MSDPQLAVHALVKGFGAARAVDSVSFEVQPGEFLSLLGPSGCGKTTLLRLIAGFELPDEGSIVSRGRTITALPPHRRHFGVVFQSYALFPHKSVLDNVCYGLKMRGVNRAEAAARARAALDRVSLRQAEDRYPSRLSGGQQQRVALARAIVIEPDMLLLDEPFSALDKNLREEMQVELRQLQKRIGIATLFVTHDQEEALTLSDRVAVMRRGRILQMDTPRGVYDRPSSRFVATFLGTTNLLKGQVLAEHRIAIEGRYVPVAPLQTETPPLGTDVTIAVRPEHVRLQPIGTAPITDGPGLSGRIREVLFQGHRLVVLFETEGGQEIRAFHPTSPGRLEGGAGPGWAPAPGDRAVALWSGDQASLIAPT